MAKLVLSLDLEAPAGSTTIGRSIELDGRSSPAELRAASIALGGSPPGSVGALLAPWLTSAAAAVEAKASSSPANPSPRKGA